jgi:AAA domain
MPQGASEVADENYLRVLVMGPAKAGKTTCCITTAPRGVFVINCDDKSSIKPAVRAWKRLDGEFGAIPGDEFQVSLVHDIAAMEEAVEDAREGVKAGLYATIVWDTISGYAGFLEQQCMDATNNAKGEPDGRRAWPEYEKRLRNVLYRLFKLKAHVIVTAHFLDVGGEVNENQVSKTGPGIVPLLGGKARMTVPAMFQDVVFFEKVGDQRYFVTGIDGVWGPGCRNLSGNVKVKADVGALMKAMGIVEAPPRKKKKKLANGAPVTGTTT